MFTIFVDADGCPVKQEIYRVAQRHGIKVTLVANTWMRTPVADWLTLEVVDDGFDAADDWIVEQVAENDIVITADIPLASRCLKNGARVLGQKGRPFTTDSIGDAMAGREVSQHLRELGVITGGPATFRKEDRSKFLQGLDTMILASRRACGR